LDEPTAKIRWNARPKAGHKRVAERFAGTLSSDDRFRVMCNGAQKLRALAEQSRLRSRRTGRGEQAKSLRALAELYERQAADLERSEMA
jgi:hypothetical protein